MTVQKVAHCTDSILTQEMARIGLEDYRAVATWYTNQNNKQSVVHSYPYHEIVLLISGNNVLYVFQGDLYTFHLEEAVSFPAGIYHSRYYTVTDIVSNRLVVRISAEVWSYTIHASGLINPDWQKNIVILSANAVSALDLWGHSEHMAQILWIRKAYQETMLDCELMELQLFINQLVEEQHTKSPSLINALISRAAEYIQKHYTEPSITMASLAKNIFINRKHLSRALKEYAMESIRRYINNLRMQHFRRDVVVRHGVLDTCANSGFAGYNSLLESFRNLYGMTPIQYRTQPNSIEERNLNTYDSQVRTNSFSPLGGNLQL